MIQDYAHDRNNTVRYTLGKYVTKPLIFFGINPSTASIEKNDATISIIEHIAKLRHYDGYMMLNIYPLRATKIDSAFPKNVMWIFAQKTCIILRKQYTRVRKWLRHGEAIYAIEIILLIFWIK